MKFPIISLSMGYCCINQYYAVDLKNNTLNSVHRKLGQIVLTYCLLLKHAY